MQNPSSITAVSLFPTAAISFPYVYIPANRFRPLLYMRTQFLKVFVSGFVDHAQHPGLTLPSEDILF
jgi:hypothetical protein